MKVTAHRTRRAIRRGFLDFGNRVTRAFSYLLTRDRRPRRSNRNESRQVLQARVRRERHSYNYYSREPSEVSCSSTYSSCSASASSIDVRWRKPVNTKATLDLPESGLVSRRSGAGREPLRRQRSLHTVSFEDARSKGGEDGYGAGEITNVRKSTRRSKVTEDEFGYYSPQGTPKLASLSEISLTTSDIIRPDEDASEEAAQLSGTAQQYRKDPNFKPTKMRKLYKNQIPPAVNEHGGKVRRNFEHSEKMRRDTQENGNQLENGRVMSSPTSRLPEPGNRKTTQKPYFQNIFQKFKSALMENTTKLADEAGIRPVQTFQPFNISRHELRPEKQNLFTSLLLSRNQILNSSKKIPRVKLGIATGIVLRNDKFERTKKRKPKTPKVKFDLKQEQDKLKVAADVTEVTPPEEVKANHLPSWTLLPSTVENTGNDDLDVNIGGMHEKLKFKVRGGRQLRGQTVLAQRSWSPTPMIQNNRFTEQPVYPSMNFTAQFAHLLPPALKAAYNIDQYDDL